LASGFIPIDDAIQKWLLGEACAFASGHSSGSRTAVSPVIVRWFISKNGYGAGRLVPVAASSRRVAALSSLLRGSLSWKDAIAAGSASNGRGTAWLYPLFFFSGFPALIYQIVWQRALFAIYGSNIESITVVVAAFMMGLGGGSLLGGYVSKRPGMPLLALFGVAELTIAAFGILSLRLFHWVEGFTAGASTLQTGVIAFLLVVLPTALMGATLPLLAEHMVRISRNVGQSVGILYSVNTLGSAMSCLIASRFTMALLGMSGAIAMAAAINGAIGLLVLFMHFRSRGSLEGTSPTESLDEERNQTMALIPLPLGVLVAGLAGFIALCYEIVWYRVYSFHTGSTARSFPDMLGFFLAGVALGSLFSRRLCQESLSQNRQRYLQAIAGFIVAATIAGFLATPTAAWLSGHIRVPLSRAELDQAAQLFLLVPVTIAAALLGATFPLMCHISVAPDTRAGERLSYLYVSNIVGSVAGSLLVGFVLMDYWGIRAISVALANLGLALGLALWLAAGGRRWLPVGAIGLLAVLVTVGAGPLFSLLYERLMFKESFNSARRFVHVLENRNGVITVDGEGTVYGGGVYDGHFNTDLVRDTNNIFRAYAISALHPAPKQVLMIGLSSGSWAQVIANNPTVERLTVVEINPGYLKLIPAHPNVAGLLQNPKIAIDIDDGRRWLVRNPGRKFDMVVMNTTFNWRAFATNVLSVEFMQLVRKHLKPGGIVFYNTTRSGEAQRTALAVFPHAIRFATFMAGSESPIVPNRDRWRQVLSSYRIEGRPVFDLSRPEHRESLEELLVILDTYRPKVDQTSLETAESVWRRTEGLRIITDNNMGTEWIR
jgi:spermidine synthase